MEIKIEKKEANPLLKRIDVTSRVAFQGATPSKKDVIKAVAKAAGAKEELIVVKEIKTAFGSQVAIVTAHVYNDRETLEKLEHTSMLKKQSGKETKKEDETKAEQKAKPEHAPKEDDA